MRSPSCRLAPKETFWMLFLPMIATVAGFRFYLHVFGVRHVYPFGYLVHHLFWGIMILIPATFALAFGPTSRRLALALLGIIGFSAGMILDEFIYLIATRALTDQDYLSTVSVLGAVFCLSVASAILVGIYNLARRNS